MLGNAQASHLPDVMWHVVWDYLYGRTDGGHVSVLLSSLGVLVGGNMWEMALLIKDVTAQNCFQHSIM